MVFIESKISLRKAVLHNVGSLNLPKFGIHSGSGSSIPLLYGICHEGCDISYRKTHTSVVEITLLEPKKADADYPYSNYPAMLPYFMLGLDSETSITDEDLKNRLYNTGWNPSSDLLYAVVMQHPHVGHCLFEGDFDPEIVFEYNPETEVVRALNQCG